jgi:hypothetical protein
LPTRMLFLGFILMEICLIWVINVVKPCLAELEQHMLSWDFFRISRAWALTFCFPKSISYPSNFLPWETVFLLLLLALVNGWMSHLFTWFITDKLASDPWLPWEKIRWKKSLPRLLYIIFCQSCSYEFWQFSKVWHL